jgi:hypothetical protein
MVQNWENLNGTQAISCGFSAQVQVGPGAKKIGNRCGASVSPAFGELPAGRLHHPNETRGGNPALG